MDMNDLGSKLAKRERLVPKSNTLTVRKEMNKFTNCSPGTILLKIKLEGLHLLSLCESMMLYHLPFETPLNTSPSPPSDASHSIEVKWI